MATKTETNLTTLNINYLSENEYQSQLSAGNINENEIYMTPMTNDDVNITVNTSGTGNAITGISASGTTITATKGSTFLTSHPAISTSTNSTSTASPAHGGTFTAIDSITRDSNGHVTKINTKTITLPGDTNTDTKVTNTLGTTTKAYVTGTTSSSTNTGTQIFDTGVYLDTTAGRLTVSSLKIGSGILSWDSTNRAIVISV